LGINNRGHIVGYYYDGNGKAHGFLLKGGNYTTLNAPSGTNGTVATGINDVGQIVGYYYDSLNHQHGFIYDGATYTTVDDPSGVSGTYATGINNRGQIVGYYLIGSGCVLCPGHASSTSRSGRQTGLHAGTLQRVILADTLSETRTGSADGEEASKRFCHASER
jgi:probable HAF family extracellular repeat protein